MERLNYHQWIEGKMHGKSMFLPSGNQTWQFKMVIYSGITH
jgi:hypothetical protein